MALLDACGKKTAEQDSTSCKARSEQKIFCSELPLEMWEKIAGYLEKCALLKFSQLSKMHHKISLSALNVLEKNRIVKEISTLVQHHRLDTDTPVFLCYQNIIDELDVQTELSDDPEALQCFKKQLADLCKDTIENKLAAVSQECFKNIKKNNLSFAKIEQQYTSCKMSFVLQALEHTFSVALNPEEARGTAVVKAAENGQFDLLKAFLAKGNISIEKRGWALENAAKKGQLEMLMHLMETGEILENDRTEALVYAADRGHLAIVKYILAKPSISFEDISDSLLVAATAGHLQIVQYLLANGANKPFIRSWAVAQAAQNGHLEIVLALLASGAISDVARNLAHKLASENGHHDVVRVLTVAP